MLRSISSYILFTIFMCSLSSAQGDDFESFTLGTLDGQSGWTATPEVQVVDSGIPGFGNRSLQIDSFVTLPRPELQSPALATGFGSFAMDIYIGSTGADMEHRVNAAGTYLSFLPGGQLGMPRNVETCTTNTFLVNGTWTPDTVHRLEWTAEQDAFPNSNTLTVRLDDQLVYDGTPQNCSPGYLGPIGITTFGAGTPDVTVDNLAFESFLPSPDFDRDGDVDLADIDDLVREIIFSIPPSTALPKFDLNGDGSVDLVDVDEWLAAAGAENLPSGNPYLRGDANLDGSVDAQDFIIWNENKFEPGLLWSQANFNADFVTDALDFTIWNDHKFMTADGTAVPEPATAVTIFMALIVMTVRRHGR